MTVAPFRAVVPLVPNCVKLAALTAAPNVVNPVLLMLISPRAVLPTPSAPTVPTTLTLPAPLTMLKALAEALPIVAPKLTSAPDVVSVVSSPSVTAPVYVCNPLVVTALASVLTPLTTKLDVPALFVIAGLAPLITKLPTCNPVCRSSVAPVIVSAFPTLPTLDPLFTTNVPAFTAVLALYVLAPPNTT